MTFLVVACSGAAAACTVLATRRAAVLARRLVRERSRRSSIDLHRALRATGWLRRREALAADRALPDVLERVARALRAGSSLPVAMSAAQPVSPPLLAAEWRRLVSETADLGALSAAERWRDRRSSRPVALTVAALAVAADVGGPQAKAVDTVATTLRQRLALQAEVRALSSQSRASAGVIAIAPVGFAALASGLEPAYLSFLLGTSGGLVMLVTGLLLQFAGLCWMSRLARIEP